MPGLKLVEIESISRSAQNLEDYLSKCENVFDDAIGAVELKLGIFDPATNSLAIMPRDFDFLTPGLSGKVTGENSPFIKSAATKSPMYFLDHDLVERAFGEISQIWFDELQLTQIWVIPGIDHKILIGHTNHLTRITNYEKQLLNQIIECLPSDNQIATNKVNVIQHELLTERQMKVLELMADALTNKQIAKELSISESTVKQETIHIYGILKVERRSEAIKYFYKNILSK